MSVLSDFEAIRNVVAGLLVGILVGLTGVGGGSLMTPLLIMLGIPPQTAVGTDLLFASLTKTVGTGVHGWRETVDWKIVRRLATGSVPAAALTLLALAQFGPVAKHTTNIILIVIAVMLLLTAISVLFRQQIVRWAGRHHVEETRDVLLPTVLLGAVLGFAVSISSVGAGAIGMTVLLVLYPTLPISRIVGSDIAHAVPLTLVAGLGHWYIGDVNLTLLGNLLVGSIPGVIFGSLLSTHAPDKWLRPALAFVLVISGWQLLVKATMKDKHAPAHGPVAAPAPAR